VGGLASRGWQAEAEKAEETSWDSKLLGVSRFHARLQYIVASYLKEKGYSVDVERCVDGIHYADVYADNGKETVIVEVETGYVPPIFIEHAEEYLWARTIVKTIKYACLASEFYIATPSYVKMAVPSILLEPTDSYDEVLKASRLVGLYFGERWAEETLKRVHECRLTGLMLVNISRREIKVLKNHELRALTAL